MGETPKLLDTFGVDWELVGGGPQLFIELAKEGLGRGCETLKVGKLISWDREMQIWKE
jgi:hypothetical protein